LPTAPIAAQACVSNPVLSDDPVGQGKEPDQRMSPREDQTPDHRGRDLRFPGPVGWARTRLRGLWKVNCEGYMASFAHNVLKMVRKLGRGVGPPGPVAPADAVAFSADQAMDDGLVDAVTPLHGLIWLSWWVPPPGSPCARTSPARRLSQQAPLSVLYNLGVAAMVGLQVQGVALTISDEGVIAVVGKQRKLGAGRGFHHVDLESYRLERKWYEAITIDGDATVSGPAETGTKHTEEEKAPLSEIIEILNEQHGMNLGEEDRLFFQQVVAKATNNEQFRILAAANKYDKSELAIHGMIDNIMVQMLSSNGALVNKYMTDTDAKRDLFPVIARSIFDRIAETPQVNLV